MGAQARGRRWVRTTALVGVLVWLAAGLTANAHSATAESLVEQAPDRIVHDVELERPDGTVLRGHVVRPSYSNETSVPVVLWSTPYGGSLDPDIHDPTPQPVQGRGTVVPVDLLVDNGYAVVQFHVRGTGHSGGCFNLFGVKEQADQAALVEWLAKRTWSTGRVGMLGQSADAITALSAAVGAPEVPKALKTIVISGILTDWYTASFSPQGAVMDDQSWLAAGGWGGGVAALPPRPSVVDPANPYAEYATGLAAPRFCLEAIEFLNATTTSTFEPSRWSQFFEDRRWLPKLGRVQAATLVWHGQQDHLAFEDDRVWGALTSAPKWQWLGQWIHAPVNQMYNHREDILLPWLNYWLKGQGPPPRQLGGVDYEVNHGAAYNVDGEYGITDPSKLRDWRRSRSWPPAEAVETTLYLTGEGELRSGVDRAGSRTFHAMPDAAQRHPSVDPRTYNDPATGTQPVGYAPPCPDTTDGHTTLVYESEPLPDDTVIAGNPRARLQLRSDLPGGSFSVQLFALSPKFGCTDGEPFGYRYLTEGGVDLRYVGDGTGDPWYRDDRYQATPFPPNEQVAVRVDLQSLAEHLPAGHRLAAVLSFGAQKARLAHGYFPQLTVQGASRLQLPVVQGGFDNR